MSWIEDRFSQFLELDALLLMLERVHRLLQSITTEIKECQVAGQVLLTGLSHSHCILLFLSKETNPKFATSFLQNNKKKSEIV